jgi:hypothetical protein
MLFHKRGRNFVHVWYAHFLCLADEGPLICLQLLLVHVKFHVTMHIDNYGRHALLTCFHLHIG